MACSDLGVIHEKKCKEWQKGGSLAELVVTSAECITIMIDELVVTSDLGFSFD
jgi:hypothetical protein